MKDFPKYANGSRVIFPDSMGDIHHGTIKSQFRSNQDAGYVIVPDGEANRSYMVSYEKVTLEGI